MPLLLIDYILGIAVFAGLFSVPWSGAERWFAGGAVILLAYLLDQYRSVADAQFASMYALLRNTQSAKSPEEAEEQMRIVERKASLDGEGPLAFTMLLNFARYAAWIVGGFLVARFLVPAMCATSKPGPWCAG